MMSTKKLVLEDSFEAYNLPLGCISHAIRAQAGGLPGAPFESRTGYIRRSKKRRMVLTAYPSMIHW